MNTQERVEQFREVFEEAKKVESLSTQETVQVAVALLQEAGKDRRTPAGLSGNGNQPATDKQKAYLKSLGIEYKDDVTKAEASELIDKGRNTDNSDAKGRY